MKKTPSFLFWLFIAVSACGTQQGPSQIENIEPDSMQIKPDSLESLNLSLDSIEQAHRQLDSIANSGILSHIDEYPIGKFKSISISVKKISTNIASIAYINLRKDCGGEYYYSWVDASLYAKELPGLYASIREIQSNFSRIVDHEETFVYSTKDNIGIIAEAAPKKQWTSKISVDCKRANSFVNTTSEDLDAFIVLLDKAAIVLDSIQ